MRTRHVLYGAALMALTYTLPWMVNAAESKNPAPNSTQIARGRYLVKLGSCNDCHTADYAPHDGKVPESQWLLGGGSLGFNGPWGTTYAPNLRLTMSRMTEAQWIAYAKALKARPPMPWYELNGWSESDLRALYQFVRSLGPVGRAGPSYLPPDKQPAPPYIQWPPAPK